MKLWLATVLLVLSHSIAFSQWALMKQPQTDVLGRRYYGNTLIGDAVPAAAIKESTGVDSQYEFVKKDFALNFGIGNFENHKFRDAQISGVKIDYIDFDYLRTHPELHHNNIAYKGLRASEVTLYFDRNIAVGVKPAELLEQTLKPHILKFIPKYEDMKFDFSKQSISTVTIKNPLVYFYVQVVRLRVKDSSYLKSYAGNSPNKTFKLTFPDNRLVENYAQIPGLNARPRVDLGLKKDSSGNLQVVLYLDEDFAKLNELENPYIIDGENIGDGIIEYRLLDRKLGIFPIQGRDYEIRIKIQGRKTGDNEVTFTNKANQLFATALRYPYVETIVSNIKTIN